MIIDGRALAAHILKRTHGALAELSRTPVVRAVVVQPSPATESYLRIKAAKAAEAGMELEVVRLLDEATTEEVMRAVTARGADAVLVQLPLPTAIDTHAVLEAIPADKDADVLSSGARTLFEAGRPEALLPPVVGAIKEIFDSEGVIPAGKKVMVVGSGWLVGQPSAVWLRQQGAEVTVITRESGEEGLAKLMDADIVVLGAGSGGLVRPDHLSRDVVIIDAGTSESGGSIVGDADPACADSASVFTPVPGGVGPIAVACLFQNAAILSKRSSVKA